MRCCINWKIAVKLSLLLIFIMTFLVAEWLSLLFSPRLICSLGNFLRSEQIHGLADLLRTQKSDPMSPDNYD